MDFFDKLGATITTKSKDVVQKTKDIAEIVKLNGQIANEEGRCAQRLPADWQVVSAQP